MDLIGTTAAKGVGQSAAPERASVVCQTISVLCSLWIPLSLANALLADDITPSA